MPPNTPPPNTPPLPTRPRSFTSASGFLLVCFAVVGLVGIMTTYVAPLPMARAVRRDGTLDQVLLASHAANPQAALEALRPMLADSADAVLPAGQPIDPAAIVTRVAAERLAVRLRLEAEQEELSLRLRVLIGVVTLMGAGFGLAISRVGV